MNTTEIIPKNKNSEEEVGQLERRRMLSRGQEKSLIDSSDNTNDHSAEEHDGSHVGSVSLDNVQGNEPGHGDAASDTAFTKFLSDDASEFQEKNSDNQKDSKENAGHQSEGNSSNVKHKDVIEELDPEIVKEYDVEEVLSKQETHDLYCPNCQTCITKRVILKKRKLTTSDSSSEPRRARLDTEGHGGSDATSPDAVWVLSSFARNKKSERVTVTMAAPIQSQPGKAEGGFGPEILKSIVYGGLAECIISLGVVSSAAGCGASPLNILALGLANLISGLIVIALNLRTLKNEVVRLDAPFLEDQEDRYKELLGKRENFRLHACISVLSFILFALTPPLLFSFSFRESYNKLYNLVSVFAPSLFCIVLLAVGKVRAAKPPKSYVKTLLFYSSIAIALAGVSYAAGYLIREFLEKINWVEPSQAGMISVLGGQATGIKIGNFMSVFY